MTELTLTPGTIQQLKSKSKQKKSAKEILSDPPADTEKRAQLKAFCSSLAERFHKSSVSEVSDDLNVIVVKLQATAETRAVALQLFWSAVDINKLHGSLSVEKVKRRTRAK